MDHVFHGLRVVARVVFVILRSNRFQYELPPLALLNTTSANHSSFAKSGRTYFEATTAASDSEVLRVCTNDCLVDFERVRTTDDGEVCELLVLVQAGI